ncbi:ABC transporter substrate-binding protein [Paenibacillus hamazuiensis]|uniref:ABC transporter substrate-binding protein n=1 Tax=Paenibacillus hamazuiensis TaxID=2936508 RepID=UPI00200E6A65|nr:ABC transporter substrate-binding protein [Paenibacillus hamazuiensis]
MKKMKIFGAILLCSALLLSACGNKAANSPVAGAAGSSAEPGKKQKVTLVQSTVGFLFSAIYIAKGKGFFEEEGLDVEVSIAGGSPKVISAIAGGGAQIGATGLSVVMDVNEKGQNIQAFASLINQYASNIVIRKDVAAKLGINENSPIDQKIKALKGLTIGINTPGSGNDKLVRYLLKSQNLNPDKDVTLVPLGNAEAFLPAFTNNQIQAFCFSSPTSDTAAATDNGMMLINLSKGEIKELDGFSHSVLLAKQDFINKNPELLQKVTNAIGKAEKFIAEDKAGAKEILRKSFSDLDPKVFDIAFENNYSAFAKSPVISKKGYDMNVTFEGINVPFEKVVVNKFAEAFK